MENKNMNYAKLMLVVKEIEDYWDYCFYTESTVTSYMTPRPYQRLYTCRIRKQSGSFATSSIAHEQSNESLYDAIYKAIQTCLSKDPVLRSTKSEHFNQLLTN